MAPSLYVPVYAEKPQMERIDPQTKKKKWMLHCTAQLSGRNDKNNFVVIHFWVEKHFFLKLADWIKHIFTKTVCPHTQLIVLVISSAKRPH